MRYRSVDRIGPEHVGHRVTVRRKLAAGGYSDVIGVCENADDTTIAVRNRRDELIVIDRSEIHAARVISTTSSG